jgi:hypothetical protein
MNPGRRCAGRLGTALLAASAAVQAGSFIPLDDAPLATVIHPSGYRGEGGMLPIRVCLRPDALPASGDPRPAIRNAVARFNRSEAEVGNVEVGGDNRIDFESMLLHELGHCLGLGHSAIGPAERAAFSAGEQVLFHANALPGPNGVLQALVGADGVRGTHDDLRGDDRSTSWFARAHNDPYVMPPAVIDRSTFSASLGDLPVGHGFPAIASAFAPCTAPSAEPAETNGSALRLVPRTQSVMYPVLCQPHRIRALAPEDVSMLRIARAGVDGVQGSGDDHRPRLSFHEGTADCEIDLRFAVGEGFAFCEVAIAQLAGGDRVIRRATATFDRAVAWHFNAVDSSADGGPQDLALGLLGAPSDAAPGDTVTVALRLQLPATVTDLALASDDVDGLLLEGIDGAACTALPCALGELGPGVLDLSLRYRLAADLAEGHELAPRWVLSAAGYDPDGRNNVASARIVVIDDDPNRILRSGFETGERAPVD